MGRGPYQVQIEALARELGLTDRVTVTLLRHDEVPDVLPACDLLLCPSQTTPNWREQFGRMTVEAFASGVAVIGSDSGEIPFVIGDAGVVVPEDDTHGWVAAIQELLLDNQRRQELTARGLRRVGRYTAEGVAPGYKQFYRWLHQQRDRTAARASGTTTAPPGSAT